MGQKVKSAPRWEIFADQHIFVVWALVFKNLVVGWMLQTMLGEVFLATHAKRDYVQAPELSSQF